MRDEPVPAGTLITGFNVHAPAVPPARVDGNLSLDLPEALTRRKLVVIANGPSARNVDLGAIQGPTLALNGAIKLFTDRGLAPTYWAVCDPQELVADLLPDEPPFETIYYVASKCHPRVFEKLRGRRVFVWHVSDCRGEDRICIPSAYTITVTASWLFLRLGLATDFDYHGWDGCFMDGRHHASGDADWSTVEVIRMNYGGVEVADPTVPHGVRVDGGRDFFTTRDWAAEGKSAATFFQLAKFFDVRIRINGDGMFEAQRRLIMDQAA